MDTANGGCIHSDTALGFRLVAKQRNHAPEPDRLNPALDVLAFQWREG